MNSLNPASKQEEFPKQVVLLVMQIITFFHPSHWRNLTLTRGIIKGKLTQRDINYLAEDYDFFMTICIVNGLW